MGEVPLHRGTSLIRSNTPLGSYNTSRPIYIHTVPLGGGVTPSERGIPCT